jgi:hypothetical protein
LFWLYVRGSRLYNLRQDLHNIVEAVTTPYQKSF